MEPHVEITATITSRWGETSEVYAGSQPTWAWELDRCSAWRTATRKRLLADYTSDPRGWRVTFNVTAHIN